MFTVLCRQAHSDWQSTEAFLYVIVKSYLVIFFYNFNADLDNVPLLVQRLRDQYVQQWHGVLSSQSTNGILHNV